MLISMLLCLVHILVYKRNFRLKNFVLINDANECYTNSCINTEQRFFEMKYLNVNDFPISGDLLQPLSFLA